MKLFLRVALIMLHLFVLGSDGFIIPDELPSILSVIYSNIPTLKKGTDSRIGWGFRLGDRADFQVLVELGPQTNTQPLANQGEGGTAKRNTLNTLANTLYAQIQEEKKGEIIKTKANSSSGSQWLEDWSKGVAANPERLEKEQQQQQRQEIPPNAKPGIAIGEIDAKSVIPEDSPVKKFEKRKIVADNLLAKAANQAEIKRTTTIRSLLSLLTQSNEPVQ